MSILNLNGLGQRPARSKRAVKVWMGIGLVIAVLGVGSTLASTITINGGKNTEFGQGVERTVYCGGNKQISVTPISSYLNTIETSTPLIEDSNSHNDMLATSAPGTFYLSGIRVSDIPEECSGVDFVLSVYPADSTDVQVISSSDNGNFKLQNPTIYWAKNDTETVGAISQSKFGYVDPGNLVTLKVGPRSLNLGSFTLTFEENVAKVDINDVSRILIETQNDVISEDAPVVHGARPYP